MRHVMLDNATVGFCAIYMMRIITVRPSMRQDLDQSLQKIVSVCLQLTTCRYLSMPLTVRYVRHVRYSNLASLSMDGDGIERLR